MSPVKSGLHTGPIVASAIILVALCAQATLASNPDYDDYSDFQANSSSGGASDPAASNDGNDIYDPSLLQQAVEDSERRAQAVTRATAPTERPTHNVATNQITGEYMSSQENITSSEEYADDQSRSQEMTTTRGPLPITTANYVRKGKSDASFIASTRPHEAGVEDEDERGNVSLSDYMDEEKLKELGDSSDQLTTKKFAGDGDDNKLVPLAMKFYQQDIPLDEEVLDNKVNGAHRPQPVPLPQLQQQALPRQNIEQRFRQDNSSDDEYYTDDSPESIEQQTRRSKATSAPTNTQAIVHTSMPASDHADSIANTSADAASTTSAPIEPVAPETIDTGSSKTSTPKTTTTTITRAPAVPTTVATTTTTVVPATIAGPATTTTTIRQAGKQGKQINISRRKLLPYEQLRNYIEDAYIRMPLAVIVDPSSESLDKTKALWRDALRTNLNIKIVLVSLNASGVPAAYNFNNTHQFLAALNSIKEHNGGDAFLGVVHASELVPYDSAVFISTAGIAAHTELVQDAAITLLKKRIRLYLIWYGNRTSSENETQEAVGGILGEVAIRSGGEILHIIGSEDSQELEASTLTLIADAFIGSQEVDVPVDTTLSSLHVKIDAAMRTAVLETPNGG